MVVTKRREEVRGSRRKSVRRKYWQMRLRLMAGKNGSVSFVPRLMCGPVRVAGVVSITSRPVCKESTTEVEEETDCKKKLGERKKHLQRQLRDIEKLTDLDRCSGTGRKKVGRKSCTRRCRKSLRSCRPCRTRRGITSRKLVAVMEKCERSMKKMTKGRRVSRHVLRLCLKSGNCRREANNVDEEIQALQAGEERRGSCASQSNGCCFDPATVEHFLTLEAG